MNNSRSKTLFIIMLSVLFLATIGLTYAFFEVMIAGNEQAKDIVTTTGTLELRYTDGQSIEASHIYPGSKYTKTISVKNTGTLPAYYSINWAALASNFLYDELIISFDCTSYSSYSGVSSLDNQESGTCEGITSHPIRQGNTRIKGNIRIDPGMTQVYDVELEFIETSTSQNYNQGKGFTASIEILEEKSTSYWYDECDGDSIDLRCKIIRDTPAYAATTNSEHVSSPGNTGINYAQTASSTNGQGLYYLENTTNTEEAQRVYFYRGDIDNNNIVFANFCWKIIRTSEDGSVRLLYNGTPTISDGNYNCPTVAEDTNIQTSFNANNTDNAHVGYMYGDTNGNARSLTSARNSSSINGQSIYYGSDFTRSGDDYSISGDILSGKLGIATICRSNICPASGYYTCLSTTQAGTCTTLYQLDRYYNTSYAYFYSIIPGSSSRIDAQLNTNPSTIRTSLDNWYSTNINNQVQGVLDLIEDTGYCNDRSDENRTNVSFKAGYGDQDTHYAPYVRLNEYEPSFACNTDINNKFTVSNALGNQDAAYPVGLITADELTFAGAKIETGNTDFYAYSSNGYWTMSPSTFTSNAKAYMLNNTGVLSENSVTSTTYLRPVLAIKGDVIVNDGDGGYTTPYIISAN